MGGLGGQGGLTLHHNITMQTPLLGLTTSDWAGLQARTVPWAGRARATTTSTTTTHSQHGPPHQAPTTKDFLISPGGSDITWPGLQT